MKHPIAQTRNGIAVYVDLIKSQAAGNISQQPRLLSLVKEALAMITASGAEVRAERDMGRAIGHSTVVTTSDGDTTFYAQGLHEKTFGRYVKNTKPSPTNYLSVILRADDDGTYELHDIWFGPLRPPLPDAENSSEDSKEFWATHAFVVDGQALQLRTMTKECPY